MLISVEKRFVFVANTKTASTSIEQVLTPYAEIRRIGTPDRKHTSLHAGMTSYDYMFAQPEHDPTTYFKFGVMRDPIDWIGSWFRYRKGNTVESPLPPDMDFDAFWARKDWNIERPNGGGKNLQRDMFCAPDGTLLADVIIPFPRLGDIFGEICDALDIKVSLQRRNVSVINESVEVSDELRAEMQAFYAEDYALFDRLDGINIAGLTRLLHRKLVTK